MSGAAQVPHEATTPPQPSPIGPQFAPTSAQSRGVQAGAPHALGVPPPPQVLGAVQPPQSTLPPQPSLCGPQKPVHASANVFGTQTTASHTLALHTLPASQLPHESEPPHPSGMLPQSAPKLPQVRG
jgi:hypothetical protein